MIVNLTQHQPTADQVAAGVVNLDAAAWDSVRQLLTFEELPPAYEIRNRAEAIADIAARAGADAAMIGGAPFLMGRLEAALKQRGIRPLYAFSVRRSIEETAPDGTVKKAQVFRHLGFVEI